MEAFYHSHWILTLLIFFPLAGALAVFLAGEENAREIALGVGIIEFLVSVPLFWTFQPAARCDVQGFPAGGPAFQNCVDAPWLGSWGIHYQLGLDGISLFMVLLTTLLLPLMVLGSWTYIRDRRRGFYASLLALTAGVVGVFVALDMFLFYVFWEIMLIPMYFMIGIWGGKERVYAAVKFFLFTTVGSLLMLVAILWLYWHYAGLHPGEPSFSYFAFLQVPMTAGQQRLLFLAFALAFAIKVPIFPFHTWLPHAHVQAPTAGSVVLAGVLLKMGTYGFIRFALPLFPNVAAGYATGRSAVILGLIGIIYTAMVAAVQPNAKRLVAYTSVAHLGFVILGIFAFNLQGMQGALLVMIGHGLSTPMLFFLLGMLYERRHSYEIDDFGGLAASLPLFATLLVFAGMASVGLPTTAGFTSEFLVLLGAFERFPVFTLIAATGVIFAAYYMLPMVQKLVFNRLDRPANRLIPDLNGRELAILLPLVALILWIGFYPRPVLDRMEPAATGVLTAVHQNRLVPDFAAPQGEATGGVALGGGEGAR
ncbi:NADH-quinone oxidoreductase subunit M [Longimicrobium sp.]|uniref:complex I subunit 4 family protein n=1 Tax=Longimicrobium sp. TaxID=2029185 RepID=UPI002CB7A87E|nr:NADH-quinone oxidoreductase subunit M [Longimicrobium sp.]HSU14647.1 NADH-quinone oxidoreductase subunit M [Longimicrobium sp.]